MRRALGTSLVGLALVAAGTTAASAQTPAITPADADAIAAAIASGSLSPTASTDFVTVPPFGTPNAVSSVPLASFPTDGSTYGIMTSGDAQLADNPNTSDSSGADDGGGAVRGNSDRDVSILRVDFTAPSGVNCLSFDFRFLSEEFPEFVGSSVNDAFVAELDTSDWTTESSNIIAPNNFAFDPSGAVISINSSGATSMTAGEAAGTTYDGATPLLRASTQLTPGAHSVFFSIFDQGDNIYDSAVFLDNMELFTAPEGGCQEGAQLVAPSVTKTADDATSPPGGTNGYTITVDNPNVEAISLNQIKDALPAGFSYQNNSTTGDITSNPSQEGQTLTWQEVEGPLVSVPANDSISFHFDVTVSNTPGEYLNEAEASSPDVEVIPTGPTAPITVLQPPTIEKAADAATSPPAGANGYTITISNSNAVPIDLDEITDTLPAGFGYVAGSTTGDVTDNPDVAGQILTWQAIEGSLVTIPAEGSISLHFLVTVAGSAGDYLNEAAAEGSGFGLDTGPTAPITVLQTPTIEKTADAPSSLSGGTNGYTITISNPNVVPVDLDEITDTLPAGFGYVAGSTTGDVTSNPSVAGQVLTWQGIEGSLVTIPAGGSISLHLGVTVSDAAGEYLNEAAAEGSGFGLETGPTAPVTVVPPVLPCDPITLEGTGAGDKLVGSDGIDRIRGLAGRDRIDALAGDDEVCGGLGGDYVYGRAGIDTLRGEEGNDRLYGGRNGDVMDGGPGHDALIGGRGPDTIMAADGTKDCIVTGRGDDSVTADPFDLVDPKKGCPPGFWL